MNKPLTLVPIFFWGGMAGHCFGQDRMTSTPDVLSAQSLTPTPIVSPSVQVDSVPASSPAVLAEPSADSTPGAPSASLTALASPAPVPKASFGVHITTSMAFFDLADLNSNQKWLQYHYQQLQNETPQDQYQMTSTTLDGAIIFEVNPFYVFDSNLEGGLAFDYWAFGSLDFDATDIHPDYFHDFRHNLNSAAVNLDFKIYFSKPEQGKPRFFLEPAAGVQPIWYQLLENYQHTSNNPSDNQIGDNVSAIALDLSLKAGASFALGGGLLSFSAGYQYAYASGFSGTWNDAGVPSKDGVHGTNRLYYGTGGAPDSISFTPDSPAEQAAFGLTPQQVANSRPMVVDLSGFRLTMDYAYYF